MLNRFDLFQFCHNIIFKCGLVFLYELVLLILANFTDITQLENLLKFFDFLIGLLKVQYNLFICFVKPNYGLADDRIMSNSFCMGQIDTGKSTLKATFLIEKYVAARTKIAVLREVNSLFRLDCTVTSRHTNLIFFIILI